MMTEIIEWVRPSGSTIKTNSNPENLKHAKSLGWKPKSGKARAVNAIIKSSNQQDGSELDGFDFSYKKPEA